MDSIMKKEDILPEESVEVEGHKVLVIREPKAI